MPGRIPGSIFKIVIASLPPATSAKLFPKKVECIAEMDGAAWYLWDDYTDLMQTIAAKLPPEVVVEIGKDIIRAAKPQFIRDGFTSPEGLLKDWAALFNAYIHGAPSRDLVRTETYAPGRVVIIGGVAQPSSLVEGYLRAVVEELGGTVTGLEVTQVILGGATYNRFVMTWVSHAV